MSDAFGAPPDGGSELQGDMPGIGAAPTPPGPQLPSALGGLAQAFQQLFGGLPQPQPQQQQQPRRPPPLPGLSQLPPPPPDMPETGSPTGPYPSWPPPWRPNRVQTYMPALPDRNSSEWGQPAPYEQTPNTWEVPGILKGVGGQLSQFGSGNVAALAMMFGPGAGAFLEAYAKGQSERASRLHKQVIDNAEEAAIRQEQELRDAHDVLATFGADPITGAVGDEKRTIKGVGTMRDALYEIAVKNDDKYLKAALENGDLKAAENILKWRDAKGRDLRAAVNQQRKDEKERELLAPWMKPGYQGSDGTPMEAQPTPDLGGEPAAEPAATPRDLQQPPEAAPAPGEAPQPDQPPPVDRGLPVPDADADAAAAHAEAQPRQPGGVQVAEAGASDAPQPGMQRLAQLQQQPQPAPAFIKTPSQALQEADAFGAETAPIDAIARKLVNNEPLPKGLKIPQKIYDYAFKRQIEIEGDLDRIQADPKIVGDKVLPAVRTVDPELADQLKGYVSGTTAPPTSARAFQTPPLPRIRALGHKIDPGFDENTFKTRNRTYAAIFGGQDGRTLVSIATTYRHLKALDNSLANAPAYWKRWVGETPASGQLSPQDQKAIGDYDANVVVSADEFTRAIVGRAGGEKEREAAVDALDWKRHGVDVVRYKIQTMRDRLKERMDTLKAQFVAGSGTQPAGMLQLFDKFTRTGEAAPESGDDPSGMVNDLLELDKRPAGPAQGGGGPVHSYKDYFQ